MPARFQAVAWDIDGTLVDSEPLHHRALVAASLESGTDLRDLPDMAFRGIHMGDVWHLLRDRLPPSLSEEIWADAINRHYVAGRRTLRPMPGAVETIRALHRQGVPQVCVSNSCRLVVDANLDALDVVACMEFSISLDDVTEGKPSPLPYSDAAARLGLAPEAVVAVEDSPTGIRSAKAAGLHALFLRTPDNGGLWTGEPQPDGMLDTLTELLAFFPANGAISR